MGLLSRDYVRFFFSGRRWAELDVGGGVPARPWALDDNTSNEMEILGC